MLPFLCHKIANLRGGVYKGGLTTRGKFGIGKRGSTNRTLAELGQIIEAHNNGKE